MTELDDYEKEWVTREMVGICWRFSFQKVFAPGKTGPVKFLIGPKWVPGRVSDVKTGDE